MLPDFPDDLDVTVDTAQNGMLIGKTLIPQIEDNLVVWVGVEDAVVEVVDTDFTTTSRTDGLYAIDGIPTGSYDVAGGFPADILIHSHSGTTSAVITRQGVTTADIEMEPRNGVDGILYGRIYSDIDKTDTFSSKMIVLRQSSSGAYEDETRTTEDGSYAFYVAPDSYALTTDGATILFFSDAEYETPYVNVAFGLTNRDAYVQSD